MINWIKIKLRIGELIEENIENEIVSESFDFDYDGKYACISFQKAPNCQKIQINVRTEGYVYKFSYPNNYNKKFDMSKLDNYNSYPEEKDD